MEPRRTDFIPPVNQAVALPTPELAMGLLRYLVALEDHFGGYGHDLNASQLRPDAVAHAATWPEHTGGQHHPLFLRAISEVWWWLIANGLLARQPGGATEDMFVTRSGRDLAAQPDGLARWQAEQRLGVELHPRLAGKVRNQFLLGEPLMKQAFNKTTGPLRDSGLVDGEREARMALFWGAIGVFKNPTSHRPVDYGDPTVAAEAVLLADLLLRMLDVVIPQQPQ